MLSTSPIQYEGREIVPIQFLKALLPDPASLGPRTVGKTNIGCIFTGKKDGKEKTIYIYNVCDHQECYREVGSQAISYTTGVPAMIGAALVVAMAQGIMQVLGGSDPTTPTVINTIMYNISNALSGVSGAVAAVLMYLFQSVFNFFVVSGTGQAAITMPIMAPLSDLLGVSRQTAVVAFQLGDAFTNLIVPTSGCLIGSLAIAKIEWSNWIKFMWKFLGVLMIGAIITVLIAVGIGF